MAILQFRDCLMHHMRAWFHNNRYTSVDAPILTPVPLYDDGSAMSITVYDERFSLLSVSAIISKRQFMLSRGVYNIGPSFRGERKS